MRTVKDLAIMAVATYYTRSQLQRSCIKALQSQELLRLHEHDSGRQNESEKRFVPSLEIRVVILFHVASELGITVCSL